MYPILSNYSHDTFEKKSYLDQAIKHLLQLISGPNLKLKKPAHTALSKIFMPYFPDQIKEKAKQILMQLHSEFKNSGTKLDNSLLSCMVSIWQKVQRFFTEIFTEEQIHELINILLINGISQEVMIALEFLLNIKIADIDFIIQIKLISTISYILNSTFYRFQIQPELYDKYRTSIQEFQNILGKNLKSINKEINEVSVCVALSCLSRFAFKDFADQMVPLLFTLRDPSSKKSP